MRLEYKPEIRQVSSIFKEYRNTIDIYTEDEDKDKEFYKNLLNRLVKNSNMKINDITPLGNSDTVLRCCENDKSCRKKLYIIDGDIYIQYAPKKTIPNLYVLNAYCIENLVICENSVCEAAYQFSGGKVSKDIMLKHIKFNETMESIMKPLMDLFFLFSIQKECCDRFNIKHIDAFMRKNKLDVNLITTEINNIQKDLESNEISQERYNKLLEKRKNDFPYSINSMLTIVSGKDFIIPFLRRHINNCLQENISLSKETWKFCMADYCDLNRLSGLRQAILSTK